MTREIKFRAWDKARKVWNYTLFEFDADGVLLTTEDAVICQYTGLKDKNGKEIYEGDIIETWYSRDTSGKDIVRYTDKVEWEQHDEKCGYEISFLRNAEVIGNIYENPELLK